MRPVMKMVALAAASALAMTACGGSSEKPAADASASGSASGSASSGAKALKVGMAFDVGGRGDGTFNDLAVKGLEKAKTDMGADIKELSPKEDGSDRADLLRQLADDGYNPIVGVGFSYGQPMDTVAKEYPDVNFIRIDGDPSSVPNVAVQDFAEHEGSFLVGAAAALKSKSNHIGFIGGNESALITKFWAGYEQGAKAVKPSIKIDDKRLAPGDSGAGFGNIDGAKVAAQAMYQNGADVVYTAAGGSFNGSFPAAVDAKKWAIGVDSDQYNTVGNPGLQAAHPDLDGQAGRRGRVRRHQGVQGHRQGHQEVLRPQGRRCRLLHQRWVRGRHQAQAGGVQAEDRGRQPEGLADPLIDSST